MRKLLLAALPAAVVTAAALTAGLTLRSAPAAARDGDAPLAADKPAAVSLPLTHVHLFSSGVGYFQREGTVEGNARIDLTFPVSDVNDLLKSMLLEDLSGGKISTVSYDSQEPVEVTLKAFALDLTYNPTFGQLLNQARGEKVEVVMQQANVTQPATINGTIVGIEHRVEQPDALDVLQRNIPHPLIAEQIQ